MMISETSFPRNSLTVSTLSRLLQDLESAQSEVETQEAFIVAVKFIQDARCLPDESFSVLIEAACESNPSSFPSVLDFAIDFHECANGDRLGLWLYPVIIKHKGPLNESLPLHQHAEAVQLLAAKFVGTAFPSTAEDLAAPHPWCLPVPRLVCADLLASMSISRLLSVAIEARTSLRAGHPGATIVTRKSANLPSGEHLYFLPMVVRHPSGQPLTEPVSCPEVSDNLLDLALEVRDQEGQPIEARVPEEGPLPFSQGMKFGDILGMRNGIAQAVVQAASSRPNLQPAGMQAQVCVYHAELPDDEDMNDAQRRALSTAAPGVYLGVTASSRLDGTPILSFVSQLENADDASKTLKVACEALRDAGVGRIEAIDHTLETIWCPDCKQIHMMAPQAELFAEYPASIN